MRTRGSKDLKPRKKRTRYRGKPIRKYKPRLIRAEKGNKTHLKIRFFQIKDMSVDGYLRFPIWLRPKLHKKVYIPLKNVYSIPVSDMRTKKDIESLMPFILPAGTYRAMGFSRSRGKYGRKLVSLFQFEIRETPEGNKAHITNEIRLRRYAWFYKE